MIVTHQRVIACTDPVACSDDFLARLGHGPALKLKADAPTDTLHGSVTILHQQPPDAHVIRVELYETPQAPQPRGRRSTLAVAVPMPQEADLQARLNRP